MGTSLEILVLLICAPLPRFEQKRLTFCTQSLSTGKLLMHYSCNGSINLPYSQLSHLSTCCLPGQ